MLEVEERLDLVDILANLYDFIEGSANRRLMIENAGLHRFIPGMNLSGSSRLVASDLVGRLEQYGPLPERPTYHALGALLSYVARLPEIPPEKARALAQLIVRYSLVADPKYLNGLREQYQISEVAVRQPPAEHVAPPAAKVDLAVPDFDVALKDTQGLEQIINSADNFLDIELIGGAIYSAQAVCRVEIPVGSPKGTGFLIGPDLLLTNQHVLKTKNHVEEAIVRFDYKYDANRATSPGRLFKLQPDFYYASDAADLDYALVKLEAEPLKQIAAGEELRELPIQELALRGKHRGYLMLATPQILADQRVNIIQHPDGDPIKVVLTQNYVVADMTATRVQ